MEAVEDYRRHRATKPGIAAIVLHMCVLVGLTLLLASGLAVALILIPEEVHDTAARVWIAVGLFGITVTGVAGLVTYSMRAFSETRHRTRDQAAALAWALSLMDADDATRYEREWGAHLHQLTEEGELKQARQDLHSLMFAGITLSIVKRVRRALSRAH